MQNTNDFLPDGYEMPTNGNGYMKLKDGENKFRILSKPIIGWEDWKDNKPIRFTFKNKPEKPINPDKKIKHFWAMIVWNYNEQAIQILQITQSSIQKSIQDLINDADWGKPYGYDIKIIRKGEKMETEYSVNPSPHKPISEEIKDAFFDKPIYLEALFDGSDPFQKRDNFSPIEDLPF